MNELEELNYYKQQMMKQQQSQYNALLGLGSGLAGYGAGYSGSLNTATCKPEEPKSDNKLLLLEEEL